MQLSRLPNFQACSREVKTAGSLGAKKGTSLLEHWLYGPQGTGAKTAVRTWWPGSHGRSWGQCVPLSLLVEDDDGHHREAALAAGSPLDAPEMGRPSTMGAQPC